jgi:predicted molibdopterin-dependent oxidoreductase YjgC
VPNAFPGGFPVNEENARRFSDLWGFPVPSQPGLTAAEMVDAAHDGALDVLYLQGGSLMETLPDPDHASRGLERVRCRIHQDIMVNPTTLLDPGETVLLLPGQTRYEQAGGGTITSTERRIRFSPEIPGPGIGESKAEWQIPMLIAERLVGPERRRLIHFENVREILEEMDRVMPMYRGVAELKRENDWVQYGGPMLCAGGRCPTPDGRAVFTVIALPEDAEPRAGRVDDLPPAPNAEAAASRTFRLTTRRGAQFNSMIFGERDLLTGAERHDVLMSPEDACALGLAPGELLRLRSEAGEFLGVCRLAEVARGTLQAYWPEANVLVPRRLDPASKEPDYNIDVRVERA